MTLEEFKSEIYSHYFDSDLQVTIDRDPTKWSTGNGLLHLGIFFILLKKNNAISEADKLNFDNAVNRCWVMQDGRTVYGLLNRDKDRGDLEAKDDYLGVSAGSYAVGSGEAYDIQWYGENNCYCYDNTRPYKLSLNAWHGRHPGLIGFYRCAAKINPGFFQGCCLKANLMLGTSGKVSDILDWVMVSVLSQIDQFKEFCGMWLDSFKGRYSSLGDMFRPYFGETHPFSQIMSIDGSLQ